MASFRVPVQFQSLFELAETQVKAMFAQVERTPENGTIHISGQRYVWIRCESLYLSWFESMAASFGPEVARDFIYNTAREIGRADAIAFSSKMKVAPGPQQLAAGPVHFAYAGWALVDILADSAPATDKSYYLHYNHPNTFESEVLKSRGKKLDDCGCFFSAGYSAGWCSSAFGIEVHSKELRCCGRGDSACEFIMAPADMLAGHEQRLGAGQ